MIGHTESASQSDTAGKRWAPGKVDSARAGRHKLVPQAKGNKTETTAAAAAAAVATGDTNDETTATGTVVSEAWHSRNLQPRVT